MWKHLLPSKLTDCSNDKNYMWEIINEYVQMLEESELGLKGIKETLEERENKENE